MKQSWKLTLLVVVASVLIAYAGFALLKPDAVAVRRPKLNNDEDPENCEFPLEYGNTVPCPAVANLQRAINLKLGLLPHTLEELVIDGLYGPKTAQALTAIGKANLAYQDISEADYQLIVGFKAQLSWIFLTEMLSS